MDPETLMPGLRYAAGAALLYGLHQVFTKLAAGHVDAGIGSFIVEATAAALIGAYVVVSPTAGNRSLVLSERGALYSMLTGVCVGAGTILFFRFFQAGGRLSAVPVVLAAGGSLMALTGVTLLGEPATPLRMVAVLLSLVAVLLLE